MKSRLVHGFFAVLLAWLLPASAAHAVLVSYWNFDNAANIGADGGTSANNLTAFAGAAYTAAGKNGGGLQLNGAQYLGPAGGDTATLTNLPTGNSTYTLAAWFKPTATGSRGIIGWGNFGNTRQVNALRLHSAATTNAFRH